MNGANFQTLKAIIIGISLGDLNIQKKISGSRLRFKQGIMHAEYLIHLFELFINYCNSAPKLIYNFNKDTNKGSYLIYFNTTVFAIFDEFYHMFYDENGIKIVPANIGDLLTPIGLAYWSMDDYKFIFNYGVYFRFDKNLLDSIVGI
jgi:LAGLIDADG DNA endonuclease family